MRRNLFTTQLLTAPLAAPRVAARIVRPVLLVGAGLLVVVALASALYARLSMATTQQPIIIVATATLPVAPISAPAVAAASPALRRTTRAIVAYSAPDQAAVIGAIEPGRAYTPTVAIGDAWLLADVASSGSVYLRIAELYDLAALPRSPLPVEAAPVPAPAVVAAPAPLDQGVLTLPQPTVDHAACCEKPAETAAERRRAFNAIRTAEAVAP
jgi:hypothetical protein